MWLASRSKFLGALLTGLLVICAQLPTASAAEASTSCKIQRATEGPISIGFPTFPDRLAFLPTARVLVVPIEFRDFKFEVNPESMKYRNEQAATLIRELSRGKASVTFRYSSQVLQLPFTLDEWRTFTGNRHQAYRNDEAKSMYGLVRESIKRVDAYEDFSNVDTILFQGSMSNSAWNNGLGVEEALATDSAATGFFRPFETAEKPLSSAVIMTTFATYFPLAHELLHNYGLDDLYGATVTDKSERPDPFSLMGSNVRKLLNWERWQLGWLDDAEVFCIDLREKQSLEPVVADLKTLDDRGTKLVVVRTGDFEAVVIEATDRGGEIPSFLTYSVRSDRRPGPLLMIPNRGGVFKIGVQRSLGVVDIFMVDASKSSARLALWSSDMDTSAAAQELREVASKNLANAVASSSAPTPRTIKCVKGKTLKRVTGIKPQCPKGFKRIR